MTYALGSLTLPDDPVWVDEFDTSPVVQSIERTLTGKLIIEEATTTKGRFITLDVAWLIRAELLALQALADIADTDYPLTIVQGSFTVRFRRPPYEVTPIRRLADPNSTDVYQVTINLLTV